MTRRLLLPLVLASLLGCGTDPEPAKTLAISPSLRASCPENPFKPEVQKAKVAAGRPAAATEYLLDIEVYDNGGVLVKEWSMGYFPLDPNSPQRDPNSLQALWDMKDAGGRTVESGYYFMMVKITLEDGATVTRSQCIFAVNPKDIKMLM